MNTLTLGIYQKGTPAEEPITLQFEDWMDHVYCAGKTGMGKSTLIRYLTTQMAAFLLIDGEGDLAEAVADSTPCIYVRAADFDFPVGINPLLNVPPDERSRVTAEIVAMMSDIFELDFNKTPQLLRWLRATIRVLLDAPGSTLLDVWAMLTDEDFRKLKLDQCKDKWAKQVWRRFDLKELKDQEAQTNSLLARIEALASYLPLQLTLGQSVSTLNFREVMDRQIPVVCNLSGIGEEPMRLLGAVILFAAQQAAAQRFDDAVHDGDVDELPEYPVIIDEFEDYASRTMPRILAKFRKRRFPMLLFHQYVDQLPKEVADAIFANCGTLMSFRVGVEDAPRLAAALDAPEDELKDLGRGKAWIAYQHGGVRASAIPIDIPKVPLPTGHRDRNIKTTQHRYAVTRKQAMRRRDIEQYKAYKERERRIRCEAQEKEREEEGRDIARIKHKKRMKELEAELADPYE